MVIPIKIGNPPIVCPFITPLGYETFVTPLDAICGSNPGGYLTNPFRISLKLPSWRPLNSGVASPTI